MSTPIIQNLIPLAKEQATKQIKRYLEGTGDLGNILDDLESWYDRFRDKEQPDLPQWHDLTSTDADRLFDAWIEAVEEFFRERLTKSDPPQRDPLLSANVATHTLPVSVDQEESMTEFGSELGESEAFSNGMAEVRKGTHEVFVTISGNDPVSKFMEASELNEEQPFARFAWYYESGDSSVGLGPIECWMLTEDQSGTILGDLLDRISSPSPASSVVLAPLVPEVVERVRDALQTIMEWDLPSSGHKWDDGTPMSYGAAFGSNGERSYIQGVAESALTALRSYSPAPSPSVELLREAKERIESLLFTAECADETGYVTDHGFINLDELHESCRSTLSKLNAALA